MAGGVRGLKSPQGHSSNPVSQKRDVEGQRFEGFSVQCSVVTSGPGVQLAKAPWHQHLVVGSESPFLGWCFSGAAPGGLPGHSEGFLIQQIRGSLTQQTEASPIQQTGGSLGTAGPL